MKEMVGGCCVCSDEHGWTENPLVYCDGQNCTVAVHQACYGIVTVPTGPWYCRKCESQERSARVRCELCPSRDGALKKTDNQGWAHVVCALYIPEVRFGNVTTMEPIILQLIPPERYAKTCYICTEIGKPSRASCGACMQCNKSGCKQQFHVTCAQALGLLCEEAGNYLDNVKYCGYCQHHYSKLVRKKKGGNVKTIPPYKPITHETGSSDPPSSPEKETTNQQINSSIPSTSSTSNTSLKTTIQNVTATIGSSSSSSSKQRKSSNQTSKNTNSSITNIATTTVVTTPSQSSIQNISTITGLNSSVVTTNSSISGTVTTTTTTANNNNKTITNIGGKDKHTKSMSNKVSSTNKNHDKDSSTSSSSSTRDKSSKSSKNNNSKDSVITEGLIATAAHKTVDIKLDKGNIILLTPNTTTSTTQPSITMPQQTKTSTTAIISTASIIVTNPKDTKDSASKFASTNFSDTNVSNTETNFVNESIKVGSGNTTVAKKRKSETSKNVSSPTIEDSHKDIIKDVSVTILPLQSMSKTESGDSDKLSKKAKIEQNVSGTGTHQMLNESILQNTNPIKSPILIQQPTILLKQIVTTNNTTAIQQSTSSMIKSQQQINKEINESITRAVSQSSSASTSLATTTPTATSSSFTSQQMTSGSTPSLVVSVPLSTTGVNIPPSISSSITSNNTSTTISSNNNPTLLQSSGQNVFQQLTQNRDSTTAIIGGGGSHMNHYQKNQLLNQNLVTNLDQQRQTSHHNLQGLMTAIPSSNIQQQHLPNSLIDHNISTNLQTNILQSTSPSSSSSTTSSAAVTTAHKNISAILTPINTDNTVLKINYEKQPNTRVAQLQDDLPGKRSSRSQSGENTKSRAYKKKGNIIQTTIPTTTTSTISATILPVSSSSTSSNINLYTDSSIGTNQQNNNNNILINSNNKNQISNLTTTTSSSTTSSSAVTTGHHPIKKSTRNKSNEIQPSSTSRTPDTNYTSISYGGGLKFTYEAQPHSQQQQSSSSSSTMTTTSSSSLAAIPTQQQLSNPSSQAILKDSPPSSPGSEAGSRKRGRKSIDSKDIKLFQNGVVATHMLGNQLNPSSSVAQKLTDQLNMEIEAHSIYTASSLEGGTQLLGPPFPGKLSNARLSTSQQQPLSNLLSGSSSSSQSGNPHQSLEQLLERQWEQGSQFLMEQAQHFDIASLLSCLHQLRTENIRLEEHVNNLVTRRDHLLAVNARLAIPLNPNVAQAQGPFNNMHINGPSDVAAAAAAVTSRTSRSQSQHFNVQQTLENGIDFRHATSHQASNNNSTSRLSSTSTSTFTTSTHSGNNRQQQTTVSVNHDQSRSRNSSNAFQLQQTSYIHQQPQTRSDDGQIKQI